MKICRVLLLAALAVLCACAPMRPDAGLGSGASTRAGGTTFGP